MATVNSVRKQTAKIVGTRAVACARRIDFVVDFTKETLGATDDLALFTLPKGTMVMAIGIEQLEPGVDATNTLVARLGTTAYSAALTANAAAGTFVAQATSTANLNTILTQDTDVNLLSAVAARTTGKVRVFAFILEGATPQVATTVDRDTLA